MKHSVREVLNRCEKTASWNGIKITDLAQCNHLGDTPLHTVCSWGELSPVEILLEGGAKVNALGDRGCTPLFNAVIGESAEVVKLLLKSGADPAIRSSDRRSILEYARNVGSSGEILNALQGRTGKR